MNGNGKEMATEASMIIDMMIIMAGWSIALLKMPPFAFIVFFFKQPRAKNYGIDAFTKNGFN
jgi:hypothetical protein